MKRIAFFLLTMLTTIGAWADGVHFTYTAGKYEKETVIYATFQESGGADYYFGPENYYLAAFINGECRYEGYLQDITDPTGAPSPDGKKFFELRVGGTEAEIGQPITFRVYREDNGFEYVMPASQSATFQGDYCDTEPSTPLRLTWEPVDILTLTQNEVHINRGQSIDLNSYIQATATQSLPVYEWRLGDMATDKVTLSGSIVTGVNPTDMGPVSLQAIQNVNGIEMSLADIRIYVDVLATSVTWLDEYKNGIKVTVGESNKIELAMYSGYTMTPADATTRFYDWSSSNEAVVKYNSDEYKWEAVGQGEATLTGTADDASGLTITLKVTVVQQVTSISLTPSSIYAEVNEDITDRLAALVNVFPDDATDKKVNWTIDAGNSAIQLKNGRFVAVSETSGSSVTMTATANDGYGASSQLYITVVPEQPKTLTVKDDPMYMTFDPSNPGEDVTTTIINNFRLTPAGLSLSDYAPTYTVQDVEGSGIIVYEPSATTVGGTFILNSAGKSRITASIEVPNYQEMSPTGGPGTKTLTASFVVEVAEGLGGFTLESVEMTTAATYALTLTPVPANAEYDASKISLNITAAGSEFPAGWTYVNATPSAADGLHYTLTAKSVGNGTISVVYDGAQKGRAAINVGQSMLLKDGWQWIALHEGAIASTDSMQMVFGDKLAEVRSQDRLLINDSQLGYFGSLTALTPMNTYKLHLKDVPSAGISSVLYGDYYMSNSGSSTGTIGNHQLYTRTGWNWIGNPYQYFQTVSDIFNGNTFTSGDIVKTKDAFATYNGTTWTGLEYITPGQGMLLYVQNAGTVTLNDEFRLTQRQTIPAGARAMTVYGPQPWQIDDSRYDDNMAMIARVSSVNDPRQCTVWAFVDGECRGRGIIVGDLQFITVHGTPGEHVTFLVYDNQTGQFHSVFEERTLRPISGSLQAPVVLHAGQAAAIDDIAADPANATANGYYDLQGRKVEKARKGVYIHNGHKLVK